VDACEGIGIRVTGLRMTITGVRDRMWDPYDIDPSIIDRDGGDGDRME